MQDLIRAKKLEFPHPNDHIHKNAFLFTCQMCSFFLNNLTGVVCSSIFTLDKPDYYFIRQKTLTTHRNSIIDGRNGYIF